jgi:hypothetical protein
MHKVTKLKIFKTISTIVERIKKSTLRIWVFGISSYVSAFCEVVAGW